MTRGTIRTVLRRILLDVPADQWSNSELNEHINTAYAAVRKQIRKFDPEDALFWETRNLESGVNWYLKPEGTRGIAEVALLSSGTYVPIKRKFYREIVPFGATEPLSTSDSVYCHRGKYIGIFPTPTANVTNGIQIIHIPTDTLSDDSDVPIAELTLHMAIVYWAALFAKGESPEDDTKEAKSLRALLSDIPADYGTADVSTPMQFTPDVADARGHRWSRRPNDVDLRL